MSIVIFGDLFSFPEGQAATNRVYTYARGFIENGHKVHVVCFLSEFTDKFQGETEGIKYYQTFQQNERSGSFIKRRWQNLLKYVRTYRILKQINREDRILAINSWTNLFGTLFFIWLVSRLLGLKVITECSEHPMMEFQDSRRQKWWGKLKFRMETFLFDGVLCISRFLVDYHKAHGVPDKKLFLVPSTVDPTRFSHTGLRPVPDPYIGYFGSLTFKRDSVDVLIRAFAVFSQSNTHTKLVLGGFCSPSMREEMNQLIRDLRITERVIVVDYLSRQEVLTYISHADVLVMARSRDLASMASYPSKLTEFLATGKPVISMNVGEVADFLHDGENAYLVEPSDHEGLAAKLTYVFEHYEEAKEAGIRGKELTQTVFHYNYQAKRILEYFQTLNR